MILYPTDTERVYTVAEILGDWNSGFSFSRTKGGKDLIDRNQVEKMGIEKVEFRFEGKRRKTTIATYEGGSWV